jgi:hypothetical protein
VVKALTELVPLGPSDIYNSVSAAHRLVVQAGVRPKGEYIEARFSWGDSYPDWKPFVVLFPRGLLERAKEIVGREADAVRMRDSLVSAFEGRKGDVLEQLIGDAPAACTLDQSLALASYGAELGIVNDDSELPISAARLKIAAIRQEIARKGEAVREGTLNSTAYRDGRQRDEIFHLAELVGDAPIGVGSEVNPELAALIVDLEELMSTLQEAGILKKTPDDIVLAIAKAEANVPEVALERTSRELQRATAPTPAA